MSADNVIYCKQVGNEWYVWHDFMSNEKRKPSKNARRFSNYASAMDYALGYQDGCGFVEGGIQVI